MACYSIKKVFHKKLFQYICNNNRHLMVLDWALNQGQKVKDQTKKFSEMERTSMLNSTRRPIYKNPENLKILENELLNKIMHCLWVLFSRLLKLTICFWHWPNTYLLFVSHWSSILTKRSKISERYKWRKI